MPTQNAKLYANALLNALIGDVDVSRGGAL
jgi:hypothetical protein